MYKYNHIDLEPIAWRHAPIWNLAKWNSVK